MMKLHTLPAFLFAVVSLTSAALAAESKPGVASDPAAQAMNSLGLDLYRIEAAKTKGNLLLSPWSIECALGMALSGAAGDTRTEMERVLHWGDAAATLRAFGELRDDLDKEAAEGAKREAMARRLDARYDALQIHVANRLFAADAADFLPAFRSQIAADWRAEVEAVPFVRPDGARQWE